MMVKDYIHKRQTRFGLNNEVVIDLLYKNNFPVIGFMQILLRYFSHLYICLTHKVKFLFFKIVDLILNFGDCFVNSYTNYLIVGKGGGV